MQILYRTKATATGGRNGRVNTSDGVLALELALPKELGGDGKKATNPEQLFAAGYAACFENALILAARMQKRPVRDTQVAAEVGIGPRANGGFGLTVALDVSLAGVDQPTAEVLVHEADRLCPYSNAVRGNVEVAIRTRVR